MIPLDLDCAACKSQPDEWLRMSPYAALLLISCVGDVSSSRMAHFLRGYLAVDVATSRRLSSRVLDYLQAQGHSFESRSGFYSSLPPYCIQKDVEEWLIMGDPRVDSLIASRAPHFEIRCEMTDTAITLERLALAGTSEATEMLALSGVRAFRQNDLIDLVPDSQYLTEPMPWSDFEPSPSDEWEILSDSGHWQSVESPLDVPRGLCRSINVDEQGHAVATRHYFRHRVGWSPITTDEARLWSIRRATAADKNHAAVLDTQSDTLTFPQEIPYAAFVAVRHLSKHIETKGGMITAVGIAPEAAILVCRKLGLRLIVVGDKDE